MLANTRQYLAGLRVAAKALLGEDPDAVHRHLEDAARPFDQLDGRLGQRPLELSRQTGGSGLVVSDSAVFDRDVHGPVRYEEVPRWPNIGGS